MSDLHVRLLEAHGSDDRHALIGLYAEASETASDTRAAWFYLTQAYVYALELGDGRAEALAEQLRSAGRL